MVSQSFTLADGKRLLIRQPTPSELPSLNDFISEIHESPGLGSWAGDVLSGRHPETPSDSAIIAVTTDGQIVGSVILVPQHWHYGVSIIPVGQLEAIGVAPAYRRQGLARALLAATHVLSNQQGQMLQAIVGPPNLYRRFGYSYALRFRGGRVLSAEHKLPAASGYTARLARLEDIPSLLALNELAGERLSLRRQIDAARWAYDLQGHSPASDAAVQLDVVCASDGAPLAYTRSFPMLWESELSVIELALGEGEPAKIAAALLAHWRKRHGVGLKSVAWELDPEHPLFVALWDHLETSRRPSAWYLRASNLPVVLARIAPTLAARLFRAGYAPEGITLAISTYDSGVHLAFNDAGVTVSDWEGAWYEADLALPLDALLPLITGYRGLEALLDSYPDLLVDSTVIPLVTTLFPPGQSHIVPLG
ncbi:MAG TPA: GNAT family N-acetyltransferase [Chloroflexaceae bacterium]|nr:GNAT family N-acetyltransferase [Chloroflexaceae bacterium]